MMTIEEMDDLSLNDYMLYNLDGLIWFGQITEQNAYHKIVKLIYCNKGEVFGISKELTFNKEKPLIMLKAWSKLSYDEAKYYLKLLVFE